MPLSWLLKLVLWLLVSVVLELDGCMLDSVVCISTIGVSVGVVSEFEMVFTSLKFLSIGILLVLLLMRHCGRGGSVLRVWMAYSRVILSFILVLDIVRLADMQDLWINYFLYLFEWLFTDGVRWEA